MKSLEKEIAKHLLQIEAVKLSPEAPFIWASGWKSPIYCDNRITLSYPETRDAIKKAFADAVKKLYPEVDVIVGVATGAIALGALVADYLDLPMVYVRSSAKGHGMGNLIEGKLSEGQKCVVIEDLVSTGGSSLKAVEALREANADVLGMLAIFTYQFPIADQNFRKANCELATLSNYTALIDEAVESGYVKEALIETLSEWRNKPSEWGV